MTPLQKFLNSSVSDVVARHIRDAKGGDLFGLELECEGLRVGYNGLDVPGWEPHADGSLRNHHGDACEWVFRGPVKYNTAQKRVRDLFAYFQKNKAQFVCSNRTSLHVHFNMSDKKAYQVVNTFILFTLFEDILDSFCGEDRNGNLFCLNSRMAEGQLKTMLDACLLYSSFAHIPNDNRYCSLNIASLNKFGSVEFRGMRGLDNEKEVLQWLQIVNELCTYACYTMHNPINIIEDVSMKTPLGFMKEVFSEESYYVLTYGLTDEVVNSSIYEGIRLVQMLCYQVGATFDKVNPSIKDFWKEQSNKEEEEEEEAIAVDLNQPIRRVMAEEGAIQLNVGVQAAREAPRMVVEPRGIRAIARGIGREDGGDALQPARQARAELAAFMEARNQGAAPVRAEWADI